VGDLPSGVLKDAVTEESNPQPTHVIEPTLGILLSYFPAMYWRDVGCVSPTGRPSMFAQPWLH
jgi:hypothetical protein